MNPSAVRLPTEFIQLDWKFVHDASDSLSRVSLEGVLRMAGGDVRPNYDLMVKG